MAGQGGADDPGAIVPSAQDSGESGIAGADEPNANIDEQPGQRTQLANPAQSEEGHEAEVQAKEPESGADPRTEFRVARLREAHAAFSTNPNINTAGTLLQYSIIAWSDHFGTTVPHVAGGTTPRQVYSEQEWTLGLSDPYGGHIIVYSRVDFPECWELRAIEANSGEREMFDLSLDQGLIARVEERFRLVMDTVTGN